MTFEHQKDSSELNKENNFSNLQFDEWYLLKDPYVHLGPFSLYDIYFKIELGEINSSDLIWKEGNCDWLAIKYIKAFNNSRENDDLDISESEKNESETELNKLPDYFLPNLPDLPVNNEHLVDVDSDVDKDQCSIDNIPIFKQDLNQIKKQQNNDDKTSFSRLHLLLIISFLFSSLFVYKFIIAKFSNGVDSNMSKYLLDFDQNKMLDVKSFISKNNKIYISQNILKYGKVKLDFSSNSLQNLAMKRSHFMTIVDVDNYISSLSKINFIDGYKINDGFYDVEITILKASFFRKLIYFFKGQFFAKKYLSKILLSKYDKKIFLNQLQIKINNKNGNIQFAKTLLSFINLFKMNLKSMLMIKSKSKSKIMQKKLMKKKIMQLKDFYFKKIGPFFSSIMIYTMKEHKVSKHKSLQQLIEFGKVFGKISSSTISKINIKNFRSIIYIEIIKLNSLIKKIKHNDLLEYQKIK